MQEVEQIVDVPVVKQRLRVHPQQHRFGDRVNSKDVILDGGFCWVNHGKAWNRRLQQQELHFLLAGS